MKHNIIYLIICLMGFVWSSTAQDIEINTRIDNWRYWQELAERGLIPFNPNVPPKKPTPKGSIINSQMGVIDSPDIVLITGNGISQSENSVFINPNNNLLVLNSNNSDSNVFQGANALFSFDGGTSWEGGIEGAGGDNSGDPAVVINNNGTSFIGHIAEDGNQGVAISNNNGVSWTTNTITTPDGFLDKNHLWVDNSTTSGFQGNLYSSWTNFGGANNDQVEIIRSTNNGATWSEPLNISEDTNGFFNQGVNIQTGPSGEVYAVWAVFESWPGQEKAIGFAKSTNGGQTFTPAERILDNIKGVRWRLSWGPSPLGKNMRSNSYPVMAVDISGGPNNGNIYVVWSNQGVPGINTGDDISVYMIRSTDNGNTWSTSTRVNQDPLGNVQYFPWITCDPVTGDLSVIFYDDRDVGAAEVETWVATSSDGGNTWMDFRVSDVAFTPAPIPGLVDGYMGDYLGIAARDGVVYPVWTDNRSGMALAYTSPFQLTEECPEDLIINTDVIDSEIDNHEAELTITANNTINANSEAIYHAGEEVLMTDGFTVLNSSIYRAYIEGCTGDFYKILSPISRTKPLALAKKSRITPQYKESENEIKIKSYPNPSTGIVNVVFGETKVNGKFQVHIYSLSRGLFFSKEFDERQLKEFQLNISEFPNGVYILKINNNGKVYTSKLIKE